jgi:UDP-N-acetylglucosamine diphosphorylase/glucosamine-1-phosphate N-acetyltransferase
MRVCIFEDRLVAQLEPLTLTRPVFELLCGQTSLRAKQARYFGSSTVGALLRPALVDYHATQRPSTPTNDTDWMSADEGPLVLVNGRWLPPAGLFSRALEPGIGLVEDEVAYVIVPGILARDLTYSTLEGLLEEWRGELPCHPVGGRMVRHLWDLVHLNPEQLIADWQVLGARHGRAVVPLPALVGPADRLVIDPTAQLDPMVVADTTNGPVILDRDVVVTAFTRLEGPCYLGPGTQVFGAKIRAGTTLGPQCRIGGEVECSIVQGYTNKYHDGFLGHAYVGEWVNLGAGSSNSDLRNDYGEVRVIVDGLSVRTGHHKVGCFLGDHTKAGLNALFNTGSNIGIFCNLLPSGEFLPRYIPSFASWWNGELVDRAYPALLFQTAEEVMRRRGVLLTEAHTALYLGVFEHTAVERRRVLREAERRQLRRSA